MFLSASFPVYCTKVKAAWYSCLKRIRHACTCTERDINGETNRADKGEIEREFARERGEGERGRLVNQIPVRLHIMETE